MKKSDKQRLLSILREDIYSVLKYIQHNPDCRSRYRNDTVRTMDGYEDITVPPSGPCDCWRRQMADVLREADEIVTKTSKPKVKTSGE